MSSGYDRASPQSEARRSNRALVVRLGVVVVAMSGWIYLASAIVLGGIFLRYAWTLYRRYSDSLARATFRYSIVYLTALFSALLVDHYWR